MTSRERVLTVFRPPRARPRPGLVRGLARVPGHAPGAAGPGRGRRRPCRCDLGDDFRRVFARYAGPPERSPSSCFTHPEATSRTPFGVERTGYGYGQPLAPSLGRRRDPPADVDALRLARSRSGWTSRPSAPRPWLGSGEFAVLGGDWSPFFHDAHRPVRHGAVHDPHGRGARDHRGGPGADGRTIMPAVSRRIFEAAAGAIDIFFIGNDFGTQNGPIVVSGHVPPVLPAASAPAGRPGPRLRPEGPAPLLRRLRPAHPAA